MGQFSSGLNNLTEIIPDYNSGISVTVTNTNTEIPRDGILKLLFSQQAAVDRSFYVNDEEVCQSGFNATASFSIPVVIVKKGDLIRGVNWKASAVLYPFRNTI